MSAMGELIIGCHRKGWRVGLFARPTAVSRLELKAVEVRDHDRALLASAGIVSGDLEAACVRTAMLLDEQGLLA
jgi:hypothetical protein